MSDTQSLTLYNLEQHLADLLLTEDSVTPDMEQEFRTELAQQLKAVRDKRDRCAEFLRHCEDQMAFADDQIHHLKRRQDRFKAAADALRGCILEVIASMGSDEKGRYPKLEGRYSTLAARRNPPSIEIVDDGLIPDDYRIATISMAATHWAELSKDCTAPWTVEFRTIKNVIKEAINRGIKVPGARLVDNKYRLEII